MSDPGTTLAARIARLHRLAAFEARLSDPDDPAYENVPAIYEDGEMVQMPWWDARPVGMELLRSLREDGWLRPFNWIAWSSTPRGSKLLGSLDGLDDANEEELVRILTTLVRQDRFFDGALASAIQGGYVPHVCRRAGELADALEGEAVPS